MYKKLLATLVITTTLAACKATPPPADVSLTNMPAVTYKLPLNQSVDINFETFEKCSYSGDSGCMRWDKLSFGRKDGMVIIERKTHNGVSGSSAVFTVEEKTVKTENENVVTYQPVKMSSHQGGMILPYPVPKLDVASYLSITQFKTKFEVDSEYPAASIKANFDRLMNKARKDFKVYGSTNSKLDLEDHYMLDVDGAQIIMLVESFPYRKGSKVVVNAVIQTRRANSGVVDVTELMKRVEDKVKSVVNS